MHSDKRALIATLAAVVCAPAIFWLAAEGVVCYEMFATGASSRAELGDDLGLGILLFMVVPPTTLVGIVVVWLVVWFWLRSRGNSKQPPSHPSCVGSE